MSYDLYITNQLSGAAYEAGTRAGAQPSHSSPKSSHPQTPQTGWTAPTVIYEKMRQINTSATSFNRDVQNVERDVLRKAWDAWFSNWKAFFEKHQSQMQKMSNIFFTDELDSQVESYRNELTSFMLTYDRELKSTGEPLPPRSSATPALPSPQEPKSPSASPSPSAEAKPGITIPWWGWMLGGAALTAGVYYAGRRIFHKAQDAQLTRVVLVPQSAAASAPTSALAEEIVKLGA